MIIRYVIGMGLYFAESYEEVMRRLVGSRLPQLPPDCAGGGKLVGPGYPQTW